MQRTPTTLLDMIQLQQLPDGGVRVKSTPTHHIDVIPMLYNWRIATVPRENNPYGNYERFWCYQGKDQTTFAIAVLAAFAWDGRDHTEPFGWLKSWDQRYANPGTGQKGVDGVRLQHGRA